MLGAWGPYVFDAPAFDALKRSTPGRWHEHPIIGRRPAGQYLGPGKATVHITGVTFPLDDGAAAEAEVRAIEGDCAAGAVYDLITGSGSVAGPYRLEKIEVDETYHDPSGEQWRVAYKLEFAAHDDIAGAVWTLWP